MQTPISNPYTLDVTFRSFGEWQTWLAENKFAGDASHARAIGQRVLANGFVEPLTNRKVLSHEIEGSIENLRENLVFDGVNSRQRAVMYCLDEQLRTRSIMVKIYSPEAVTKLALRLRGRYPMFYGSEFTTNEQTRKTMFPIPQEDLTGLSFPSATFDFVMTNEVLEHVPSLDEALGEMARVLVPGGMHIGTHPFLFMREEGERKAKLLADGEIEYITKPEYHGDPFNSGGSLVFELPGWDILERAKKAGFKDAYFRFMASEQYAYLSDNTGIFVLYCVN